MMAARLPNEILGLILARLSFCSPPLSILFIRIGITPKQCSILQSHKLFEREELSSFQEAKYKVSKRLKDPSSTIQLLINPKSANQK